ncbi:MAG TPA: HPr-rel-A system PqqD family peptide chaperone [Candidatus Anammoximicrobium sp.]|nr:HPr-rel-A system PqqD family peptide chaperone [Candidatus Anammoximicrobium sp.]
MTQTIADLPADARLIANPNLVLREEEDDAALLFDPETGSVNVLNSTGLAVWRLLDGNRDRAQIMGHLREEFDGLDAAAEEQVAALLKRLVAIGAAGVVA